MHFLGKKTLTFCSTLLYRDVPPYWMLVIISDIISEEWLHQASFSYSLLISFFCTLSVSIFHYFNSVIFLQIFFFLGIKFVKNIQCQSCGMVKDIFALILNSVTFNPKMWSNRVLLYKTCFKREIQWVIDMCYYQNLLSYPFELYVYVYCDRVERM